MSNTRRRAAVIAAVAAAFAAALGPHGPVLADEEPVVTIDGTICYEKVKEGNSLLVSLSSASKEEVVVAMHTEDGTAKSPDDYRGSDRVVVVFKPGQLQVRVPLFIVDDDQKEPDEYFLMIIDSVQGAGIGNGKAVIVIKDGAPPRR